MTRSSEKRHNGGSLLDMYSNRPKSEEVDVRLLKNEMVLTQAQQAGLFNFIRTANRPTTANAFSQSKQPRPSNNKTVTNHFHIAEMNVRDDHDIEKIAVELKRMERQQERSSGR